ncbi:glycosyltransferase family 4 protein [Listeria sp. PSOL-1]|uniref:glycosyltransferase family 4 protein n=1 Tax=Listeria sp. PSOL-1 TaxID=1844999 RepID=UPI0013D4D708|nr:glycosyltransferase family 4 protein [Listeria sp. PSOL-1]
MKIALISNMYPSKKFPAYGIFVKNQYQLLEKDHEVTLIVMQKEPHHLRKLIAYIKHYLKIIWLLLFQNYDLVYVHYATHHAIPVLFVSLLRPKLRILVNVHGSDILPNTKIQIILQFFSRHLFRRAQALVAPSLFFKLILVKNWHIPRKKIFVSPSGGINRAVFSPVQKKPIKQAFMLGYVGRIDHGKGWDDVLYGFYHAMETTDIKAKLIMVGNGAENEAKKALIKELQLEEQVICHDFLSHQELVEIYNQLDVFVFPTCKYESLGLVGLEAMACGVPIIGTKRGGLATYMKEDVNSLSYPAGNRQVLAEKLIYLVKNQDKLGKLKQGALKTAAEYDSKVVHHHFLTFLRHTFSQ